MGEGRHGDDGTQVGAPRTRQQCGTRPHGVSDHADAGYVLAGGEPVDGHLQVLGEARHGDEVVVFASAVVARVQEQRMNTGAVQMRSEGEHE